MQTRPWTLLAASVLGLLLGTQTQLQVRASSVGAAVRPEEAAALLKTSEQQRLSLEQEVRKLRQQVKARPEPERHPLSEPDSKFVILSGMAPVEGPGVRVQVDERKSGAAVPQGRLYRLHDEDLLRVVNELFSAGAEALSVNNQRVVATTEIRNAGAAIQINGVPTAPPYDILAIGDRTVLEASLRMRGGIIDVLRIWDIQVQVHPVDRVVIPAFRAVPFRYARPMPQGNATPLPIQSHSPPAAPSQP